MAKLNSILAELYSERRTAKLLLRRAEIDDRTIDFSGSAFDCWTEILHEAGKRQQVTAIVKAAQSEYGERSLELEEALQQFLGRHGVFPQLGPSPRRPVLAIVLLIGSLLLVVIVIVLWPDGLIAVRDPHPPVVRSEEQPEELQDGVKKRNFDTKPLHNPPSESETPVNRTKSNGISSNSDKAIANAIQTAAKVLDLHNQPVRDEHLKFLEGNTSIEHIDLGGTHIDGGGLQYLEGLKSLRILFVYKTNIDNDSLAHVGRITSLRKLDLSNNSITDDGLRHLSGLDKLEELILAGTHVSNGGIAELQSKLPFVLIRR